MAHILIRLVGVAGFEPAAHWSQTSCATKLRYTPIVNCLAEIIHWQGQKDSNPRHAVLETAALPTELYPYTAANDLLSIRNNGGEGGIRTHAALANPNDLANRPLQPLEYFSKLN